MGTQQSVETLHIRLLQREEEHRSLDQMIAEYAQSPLADQLFLRRLKKRKLALKEEIQLLMNLLNPDIIA